MQKISSNKALIPVLKAELGLDFKPATRTSWHYNREGTYTSRVLRAPFHCNGKDYHIDLSWALGSVDHIWFVFATPADKEITCFLEPDEVYRTTTHTVINGKFHKTQLQQLLHYTKEVLAKLAE